jgi:cytochrome c-type biogenesis protein CcmE
MEPTSSSPAGNKRRAKFIIGGGVVVLALVGLTVWAMARPGSTAYYKTTTEVQALGSAGSTQDVRVNGDVVAGSIQHDGLVTEFEITDGTTAMLVSTDQPLPDTFKEGSEVVARGRYDGDRFAATEVIAKCPSKFKAKA